MLKATNREIALEEIRIDGGGLFIVGVFVPHDTLVSNGEVMSRHGSGLKLCSELRRAFEHFLDERDREARNGRD